MIFYRKCMGEPAKAAKAGTFAALIENYKGSPEWRELAKATRANYGRYLVEIERLWGKLMVSGVEPKHVLALRDAKSETPAGGELSSQNAVGGHIVGHSSRISFE